MLAASNLVSRPWVGNLLSRHKRHSVMSFDFGDVGTARHERRVLGSIPRALERAWLLLGLGKVGIGMP